MAEPALTDPGLAPALVAAVIYVALLVYTLTGGADFGGGVWDLFAAGPRRDRQRALVARAIGPIWEANHVWLIVVVVLLFVCFPPAFAAIMTALHIPLTLMLIGVVLRGSAFVFRAYDPVSRGAAGGDTAWGRVFAVSSLLRASALCSARAPRSAAPAHSPPLCAASATPVASSSGAAAQWRQSLRSDSPANRLALGRRSAGWWRATPRVTRCHLSSRDRRADGPL